ncbi:HNH endonuclease signature motif containing protein [Microbacterium sp. A1-JK]|uniref:HNH endonuclease signature motif containing protein n=1 Tax=Microbacterium sp. A1-JK TaxID=3177516 RepID=UPI0038836C03
MTRIKWEQIQFTDTCWLWLGPQIKGYGKSHGTTAHRVVYRALVGPIPEGLELDHLCMRKLCVNPEHLEPVTRAENMRRRAAAYVTCVNGHDFSPENTYIRPGGGRDCRQCIRRRVAKHRARRRSVAA